MEQKLTEVSLVAPKPPSAEELAMPQKLLDLTQQQEQMRTVMTMLGTVLAVAFAGKTPDQLVAAHAVMDGIIANIENVYNWPDANKRMVYETMKGHQPFKEAIERLNAGSGGITPKRGLL